MSLYDSLSKNYNLRMIGRVDLIQETVFNEVLGISFQFVKREKKIETTELNVLVNFTEV